MPVEIRITLRLPLAVHTALTKEAKDANVSMNQLIVDRLNASTGNPYRGGAEASVAERVDMLESELGALRAEVAAMKKRSRPA